ncbi:MAG: putative cytosolic protein [uncultured bacterium]|nr:MAG: putative cytosolic protein [uncultured bacterium]
MDKNWDIKFSTKAAKQVSYLDERILLVLQVLVDNLRTKGPTPGKNWQNYGKLHVKKNEDKRHCHLIKGSPTYVCCWKVNKSLKCIEVYYVGTHEKAPY